MINGIRRLRVFKPFRNKRGGFVGSLFIVIVVFSFISLLTWSVTRATEAYIQARIDTLCYKMTDAIAGTGEINDGIQTELYKGFDKLKFYTGSYKIEVYKYNYKTYFSRDFIGSSVDGSKIAKTTIPKGDMVQVVFKADKTTLDKITNFFKSSDTPIGIAGESSSKVD